MLGGGNEYGSIGTCCCSYVCFGTFKNGGKIMGQRSQIYIRTGNEIIARYYSWNYGERMISRARYLVEWLEEMKEYLDWNKDKIHRIADTNFNMIDVVVSSDIVEEYNDWPKEDHEFNEYVFGCPGGNNDGKLYIDCDGNEIKYAFTDDEDRVLDPWGYLKWDMWEKTQKACMEHLPEDAREYTKENIKFLKGKKMLMQEEVGERFLENTFENDPTKPF